MFVLFNALDYMVVRHLYIFGFLWHMFVNHFYPILGLLIYSPVTCITKLLLFMQTVVFIYIKRYLLINKENRLIAYIHSCIYTHVGSYFGQSFVQRINQYILSPTDRLEIIIHIRVLLELDIKNYQVHLTYFSMVL